MLKPYLVSLEDGRSLPCPERIAAEVRFITELERRLGGADEVARTYRAWVDASESQASDLGAGIAERAARWPHAYQKACEAGLQNVHGLEEAEFVVKLVRSDVAV